MRVQPIFLKPSVERRPREPEGLGDAGDVPVVVPHALGNHEMRLSSADVALAEVLGVIAVDVLAIYLIFRGAAKIFRASALMYGKRPTLPELVRWLRAA